MQLPARPPDAVLLYPAVYTRGRVAYLLSISRELAIGHDAFPPDSLATCTPSGPGLSSGAHDAALFAIAEWTDVARAKHRVLERGRMEEAELALELRVHGHTNGEIAELLKVSAATAWRRAGALLELILEELGGEAELSSPSTSQVSACLKCGTWPRARLRARFKQVQGRGKVVSRPERESALCEHCLPEDRRGDIITERSWRAAA